MKIKDLIIPALVAGSLLSGAAFADNSAKAESAGKKVDDAWITTKVKTDLAKDSNTSAAKIHVNTQSGVVVLTGTVASIAEKTRAEENARSVKGVVDVENQLRVASAE